MQCLYIVCIEFTSSLPKVPRMWKADRAYPKLDSEHTRGRFKGHVVVVTGGCSGIGRAAVDRFANDGAQVYALDIK